MSVTELMNGRCSERIAALRSQAMERKGSFVTDGNPFERDVALWRASKSGRSRVQVRAALLHELVKIATLRIPDGWTLAGEHLPHRAAWPWPGKPDAEQVARIRDLGLTDDEIEAVGEACRIWHLGRAGALSYAVGETDPDNVKAQGGWKGKAGEVYWAGGWTENHSVRDYAKVLRLGFGGIRKEAETALAAADIADPEFPQKENFWRAALQVCDAGCLLGQRYADLAAQMAANTDSPDERARLERMAEACSHVPAEGARTFFEATQALWLAHILTCGEDGINANSIGRLDQMLFPYYRADIDAARLTRTEACEIMEELACKLYLEYDVQAITLGGQDEDGNDAVNELSHVILDATRNADFVRDLSIRLHKNSPPEFVDHAARMIARGGGIPFIFNDDCFVKALNDRGIAIEDARNYAPIGCIELTVPGRANPHAVSGWFSGIKCLELALFNGEDPTIGEQVGPQTGQLADFSSIEDLYEAYTRQVEYFAKRMVYQCNRGELRQRESGPLPCWSTLTDDCIPRGRDITDGGAVYDYHSICFLGSANIADSLMALKKLLFEEKHFTPGELLDALRKNFEGREPLRQMLLSEAPKYGNDCDEVDELARRACGHFIALMDRMRSPLDGRYYVHLFTFLCNIQFGKSLGATPDGRRAREPLAYSLSAHQGRDEHGLTAMINSLAKLPHDQAAGATAAILEIDPVLVKGEAGVERLSQTIQAAIAMGVGQMQWNVTTVERLRKAQEDPEKYGNIPVRVAGFSQMFKLVEKELQDHIIARTKHKR
ncbi:MAG: pyruvate formate lyase family protein [Planctomycetota bacterium]